MNIKYNKKMKELLLAGNGNVDFDNFKLFNEILTPFENFNLEEFNDDYVFCYRVDKHFCKKVLSLNWYMQASFMIWGVWLFEAKRMYKDKKFFFTIQYDDWKFSLDYDEWERNVDWFYVKLFTEEGYNWYFRGKWIDERFNVEYAVIEA